MPICRYNALDATHNLTDTSKTGRGQLAEIASASLGGVCRGIKKRGVTEFRGVTGSEKKNYRRAAAGGDLAFVEEERVTNGGGTWHQRVVD